MTLRRPGWRPLIPKATTRALWQYDVILLSELLRTQPRACSFRGFGLSLLVPERLFEGDTVTQTLAGVLNSEIGMESIPSFCQEASCTNEVARRFAGRSEGRESVPSTDRSPSHVELMNPTASSQFGRPPPTADFNVLRKDIELISYPSVCTPG
jgi:hypothetical protein